MNSLPVEMIREIFLRMDDRTAHTFRLTSPYFNQIYRTHVPKELSTLCIDFTDEIVLLRDLEQKWPRITLVINHRNRQKIEHFNFLEILGKDKDMVVYETSDLASSLQTIVTEMTRFYCMDIMASEFPLCFRSELCTHCLYYHTGKKDKDEVGRRLCRGCSTKIRMRKTAHDIEKRFEAISSRRNTASYDLLRTKASYERILPALSLTKEEITEKFEKELPHVKGKFTPWRIKYLPTDRSYFSGFLSHNMTRLHGHRTGAVAVDAHNRIIEVWTDSRFSGNTLVVLAHDEIFVCHPDHIGDFKKV